MATVFLAPDQDAVVAEIEIAAPPQRVFAALTDAEQNKEWGRSEAFQITQWEMDARVGGACAPSPGRAARIGNTFTMVRSSSSIRCGYWRTPGSPTGRSSQAGEPLFAEN
jgi:hypothetical protein